MSDSPLYESLMHVVSALSHSGYDAERESIAHAATAVHQLERERLQDVNALMEDIRKGDDMLMAWFKAASPYATPGSLEEVLKDVERFRILSEYVAAIIWKKDSDLPPLGHLKNGFSIDDLRAWCDGAKK